MHPAFKVETALQFASNAEDEQVTEVGICLNTFEDADAEACRELLVNAVQISICRKETVFGEANGAEWYGTLRRHFQIALGHIIGIVPSPGMNVEMEQSEPKVLRSLQ